MIIPINLTELNMADRAEGTRLRAITFLYTTQTET